MLAVAGISVATGYAQFGVTAALADVAAHFGEPSGGSSIAAQAGLSGTVAGLGLAAIRGASLASLPIAGSADRYGRRSVLLAATAFGLALTALAALSPSYWWFVAIFALGRPALSAANALAGVAAAEETRASDRAKAIGLVAGAYGIGAGLASLVRALGGSALGFRGLFGLALVPLALLGLLRRRVEEPDRFRTVTRGARTRLGSVPTAYVPRLALLSVLAVAFTVMTGPANTFLFFYGEGVLGLSAGGMFVGVIGAGVAGFGGLLVGRSAADVLGRRATAAATHLGQAVAFAFAYRGGAGALFAGYILGAACQGAYGIGFGALSAEVFPTSVRATAAGWLTVATVLGAVMGLGLFGLLADSLSGSFAAAAIWLAAPMGLAAVLLLRLPETRGLELEESAPEPA